jgi:hypothetical protein
MEPFTTFVELCRSITDRAQRRLISHLRGDARDQRIVSGIYL